MKIRFLFIISCVLIITFMGWELYLVRSQQAEQALLHIQTIIQKIAGDKGHVSYGSVSVPKISQTIILNDFSLVLEDGTSIQIKKLRIIPVSQTKLLKLVAEYISIQKGGYTVQLQDFYLHDIILPVSADKFHSSLQAFSDFSFRQGSMDGVSIDSQDFHYHVGIKNIQLGHALRDHKLVYTLSNVEYFPFIEEWHQKLNHRVFIYRLTVQTKDNQKQITGDVVSSLLKNKSDLSFDFQGMNYYQYSLDPYWICKKLLLTLSMQGRLLFQGTVNGTGIAYNTAQGQHPLPIYLNKIGYSFLKGSIEGNFSYNMEQNHISWHPFIFDGENLVYLISQLDLNIDQKHILLKDKRNILDLLQGLQLKSFVLFIQDAGIQNHILKEVAKQDAVSQIQAKTEIIQKLSNTTTGKDFILDRQFYSALVEMLKDSNRQMKVTVDLPQEENIYKIFNMNFLDFFKMANQGNMQITTMRKQ